MEVPGKVLTCLLGVNQGSQLCVGKGHEFRICLMHVDMPSEELPHFNFMSILFSCFRLLLAIFTRNE